LNPSNLPDHFFRHEYGRLVAVLSGRMGVRHLELVEDAVQGALLTALETWRSSPLPENPSAWLYRVAFNRLIGDLRQRRRRLAILKKNAGTAFSISSSAPEWLSENEINDDLLRMLFFCCDPALPVESQLVLSLKTLCGFDVREIALRLFTTEENVYKRLARARSQLKTKARHETNLYSDSRPDRLEGVRRVLYSLFSEGYLSTHLEFAIRNDLCVEAIRLTNTLVRSTIGATPETAALLAMMYFHEARLSSRVDGSGGLVLLEDQDRRLWDRELIQLGLGWLELSARGESYSRYHAEAAIAVEHCLAPSFSKTNWHKIIHHYDLLISVEPSALHELNRTVAIAEVTGPSEALVMLEKTLPPTWLALSYLWSAVLADLHFRNGNSELGKQYFLKSLQSAPSNAIKKLLTQRYSFYSEEIKLENSTESNKGKTDNDPQ
jgi:RNA polymerase sigma factor (sigma-70 family)